MRRKRSVRLHLLDGPSIEGVMVAGRVRGPYVIWAPRVLEEEDATVTIEGHVEVPRERVLFYQVLAK